VALELLLVPELAQAGVVGVACRGLVPGHGAAWQVAEWTSGAVPAGKRGQSRLVMRPTKVVDSVQRGHSGGPAHPTPNLNSRFVNGNHIC
jgi:hypothetical protein